MLVTCDSMTMKRIRCPWWLVLQVSNAVIWVVGEMDTLQGHEEIEEPRP